MMQCTEQLACMGNVMTTPKASGAGELTWDQSPAHEEEGIHQSQQSKSSTYYEAELERLRAWHPQQSRFKKECERKCSSGGAAPPASFLHHHRGCFSPEQ